MTERSTRYTRNESSGTQPPRGTRAWYSRAWLGSALFALMTGCSGTPSDSIQASGMKAPMVAPAASVAEATTPPPTVLVADPPAEAASNPNVPLATGDSNASDATTSPPLSEYSPGAEVSSPDLSTDTPASQNETANSDASGTGTMTGSAAEVPVSFYVRWAHDQIGLHPLPGNLMQNVPIEGPLLIRTYLESGGTEPPEELVRTGSISAETLHEHVAGPYLNIEAEDGSEPWPQLGPDAIAPILSDVPINYQPLPATSPRGSPTYFAVYFPAELEPATTYHATVILRGASSIQFEFATAAGATPALEVPTVLSLQYEWESSEEFPGCELLQMGDRDFCALRTHRISLIGDVDWHASAIPSTVYSLLSGGDAVNLVSSIELAVAPPNRIQHAAFVQAPPEPTCISLEARRLLDGTVATVEHGCFDRPPLPSVPEGRILLPLADYLTALGIEGYSTPSGYYEGYFLDG